MKLNRRHMLRLAGATLAGTAIPGHGGFLDRMDSLLAATLAFAVVRLIWPAFPFAGIWP